MSISKLTESITLKNGVDGWFFDPEWYNTATISDDLLVLEAGTIIRDGDTVWDQIVESGHHAGVTFKSSSVPKETLLSLDKETGEIYVSSMSYGWNCSYSWYPIGVKGCPHPYKTRARHIYTLKPGETLHDFPTYGWREDQLAWVKERQARWYPEQEAKVIKYLEEYKILSCDNLYDLCDLIKVHPYNLEYSLDHSDPGQEYRRQGFHLGMTSEEAYELGRSKYYGFSWNRVKSSLAQPRLRIESWTTPEVWVKAVRNVKEGRGWDEKLVKVQQAYKFSVIKNLDTKEYSVVVSTK